MWPDKNEEEPEWVKTERETFKTLRDKNGDGKMDLEEVKNWIIPPDYDHTEAETRHLIHESDSDKVCTHFGLGWGFIFKNKFKIMFTYYIFSMDFFALDSFCVGWFLFNTFSWILKKILFLFWIKSI